MPVLHLVSENDFLDGSDQELRESDQNVVRFIRENYGRRVSDVSNVSHSPG